MANHRRAAGAAALRACRGFRSRASQVRRRGRRFGIGQRLLVPDRVAVPARARRGPAADSSADRLSQRRRQHRPIAETEGQDAPHVVVPFPTDADRLHDVVELLDLIADSAATIRTSATLSGFTGLRAAALDGPAMAGVMIGTFRAVPVGAELAEPRHCAGRDRFGLRIQSASPSFVLMSDSACGNLLPTNPSGRVTPR